MTSQEFRNNPMFLRNQFEQDGIFGIPKLKKDEIDLEEIAFIGYDKLQREETNKIVHFFLNDYKFEVMWNHPESKIERLRAYRAVLTPNFSMYTEMPLSLQLYNTFRSRWCGAFLQANGIPVIPTVCWSTPESFWFCFDGLPQEGVVAVSTLGVRTEKTLFMQGYYELKKRVNPAAVLCYGKPFEEMKGNILEVDYEQTNHYGKEKLFYRKKIYAYVEAKGMGGAGGGGKHVKLPENDSQIKHIFRNSEGHLPNTPENRQRIEALANDSSKYQGTDKYGNRWNIDHQGDGQLWVRYQNGKIMNGGLNKTDIPWDPETGLNDNPSKWFDFLREKNPFS